MGEAVFGQRSGAEDVAAEDLDAPLRNQCKAVSYANFAMLSTHCQILNRFHSPSRLPFSSGPFSPSL